MYDPTGHIAIQIMKQPPPEVATDDWDKFTVEERVALYDVCRVLRQVRGGYNSRVVVHLPEADLSRLYIGGRETRHVDLTGDHLVLSERWTQSGREWSGVREFVRLK
jgi:hypothetical protein